MALPPPEEFIKAPSWSGLSLTDKQRIAQRWRQEAYKKVISSDGFDYSHLDAIEDKALPKFGIEEDIFDAMGKGVDAFNATIQRWVPQEAIQDSMAAKNEMDRFQAELDRASADVNENAKKYNRPVSEDETDYLKQLYSKVNEATDKFGRSQIKAESFIGWHLTAARKDVQPHSMQIFNALPDNDAGALKWFFSSPTRGASFIAASLASTMPDLAKIFNASLVGGPIAGGAAGGLSEYSASLYQKLQEEAKGDPAVMAQLLGDKDFISKIKGEAAAKGVVITAVDTATLKVGGVIGRKLINDGTRKAARVGIGALGAVAGGVMQGVGEMASAVAANDPVSIKEGIQESIPGFVLGGVGVAAKSFSTEQTAGKPFDVEKARADGYTVEGKGTLFSPYKLTRSTQTQTPPVTRDVNVPPAEIRNVDGRVVDVPPAEIRNVVGRVVDDPAAPDPIIEDDGISIARPIQEPFVKIRQITLPNGKVINQTVPISPPQSIANRQLPSQQFNAQQVALSQLTSDTEAAKVDPLSQLTGDPSADVNADPTPAGGFESLTNDTEARTPQLSDLSSDTEAKPGVARTPEQQAYARSNTLLNALSSDTEARVSEIINDPKISPETSVETKAKTRQEVVEVVAQETGASKIDAAKKVASIEAVPEPVFEDEDGSPLDGVEKAYADGIIPDLFITEDDPTDDLITDLEGFRDAKYGEGNEAAEKAASELLAYYEGNKKANAPTAPVTTPVNTPKSEALTGPDGKPETPEARKQRIADTIAAFSALSGETEAATPKPNLDDIQSLNEAVIDGVLTPEILAELESGTQDLSPEATDFVDDNSIDLDVIKETLAEWKKRNPLTPKNIKDHSNEAGLPEWVRQEMQDRGYSPDKMGLRLVDVDQRHIREAVMSDPTLSEEEKANVIGTGSKNTPREGTEAAKRVETARKWIEGFKSESGSTIIFGEDAEKKRNPLTPKESKVSSGTPKDSSTDVFAPTKFESREDRIERAQALIDRLKWGEDIYSEARDEATKSEEENGGVPTARLLDISREITNRGYEDEYGVVALVEEVARARKEAILPPELVTEFPTDEIVTELESIRYGEDDAKSDKARELLDAYESIIPLYERGGYGKGTLHIQIAIHQLGSYDDNERTTIRQEFGVDEYNLGNALIEERDRKLEAKWAAEDADKKIATIKSEADNFKKLAGKGYGKSGIPKKYFGPSTDELVDQLEGFLGAKEDAYQNYIGKANPDANIEGARQQEILMLQDLLDAHNANLTKPEPTPIPFSNKPSTQTQGESNSTKGGTLSDELTALSRNDDEAGVRAALPKSFSIVTVIDSEQEEPTYYTFLGSVDDALVSQGAWDRLLMEELSDKPSATQVKEYVNEGVVEGLVDVGNIPVASRKIKAIDGEIPFTAPPKPKPVPKPIPVATVIEEEEDGQDYSGDWGDDGFADSDFYEGTLEDLGDTRVDVSDFSEAYNDRARDRFSQGPGAAGAGASLAGSYPDPLDVGVANSKEGLETAAKVKKTLRAELPWRERTIESIKNLRNTRLNRNAARQAKDKAVTMIVNQFRPLDTLVASVYERSQAALIGVKDNMMSRIFEQVAGASGKALADVKRFDKAVLRGLPEELWQDLNEYIFLFRAYDRLSTAPGKNKRGVAGYTAQGAADALATMEGKLGAEAFSKIEAAASIYQSFGNKALDLQVVSGRLSAKDAQRIKALNDFYAPFKVLSHLEKQETHAINGKAIDSKQPLFKMITGITKDDFQIKNPIQAMRENVYRSRILAEKNLAMQELAKVASIKPRDQETIIAAKLYIDHQDRVKRATDAGDVAAVNLLQDEFEDSIIPGLTAKGLPDPSLPKHNSPFVVSNDAIIRQAASQDSATDLNPVIIDVFGFMDRKTENEKKRRGKKMIHDDMAPVHYFANGAKRTMFVPKDAARAVQGISKAEMGVVAHTARAAQAGLRLGATTGNMAFVLPNLIVDVGRMVVTSKAGLRSPLKAPFDAIVLPLQLIGNAFYHRPFKTETYTKFLESGAASSNFQAFVESFGNTSTVTAPTLFSSEMGPGRLSQRSPLENVIHILGTPASILEEAVKMTGHQRLLNQLKEQGIDPNKDSAAMRALVEEVRNHVGSPDFLRKGQQITGNLLFMFFNARIQGVAADSGRMLGADGWKPGGAAWMRMTALVGVPTVTLMAYIMSDDDILRDYLKIPERERQDNWMIPWPGTSIVLEDGKTSMDFFRMPRRDTIGAFANFIESFMLYAGTEEPITATQIFGDTVAQFSPISMEGNGWGERLESVMSQLNPIVKVPAELATGRNFYFHSDVIPASMEGGNDRRHEYTAGTNEFYKKAASLVPDWGPDELKSPIVLQHASRGFFAGMVEQFVGRKPLEGRSEVTGYPLIGPVIGRFLRSRYASSTQMDTILDNAEAQQVSDRNRDAHKADILVEEFKLQDKATVEKELRVIAKEDPVLLDAVERALKQEERGLGFADRRLKRLSVDRGIKAGAVEQILRQGSMTNELRDQFIAEKLKNDTISLEVKRQVRKLLKEKPIKGWEMK